MYMVGAVYLALAGAMCFIVELGRRPSLRASAVAE